MKDLKWLALCVCALILTTSLTACQTLEGAMDDFAAGRVAGVSGITGTSADTLINRGNCPNVEIVEELATMREFGNMNAPSPKNLITEVKLKTIDSSCTYKNRTAQVDVKLAFEGTLGPHVRRTANDKPFFAHPYFIAIANPSGAIMAKEVFSAPMAYEKNQDKFDYYEGIRQIIPLYSEGKGSGYKILIGFQLSEQQLQINREIAKAEEEARRIEREAQIQDDIEKIQDDARRARQDSENAKTMTNAAPPATPADPNAPISLGIPQ